MVIVGIYFGNFSAHIVQFFCIESFQVVDFDIVFPHSLELDDLHADQSWVKGDNHINHSIFFDEESLPVTLSGVEDMGREEDVDFLEVCQVELVILRVSTQKDSREDFIMRVSPIGVLYDGAVEVGVEESGFPLAVGVVVDDSEQSSLGVLNLNSLHEGYALVILLPQQNFIV